MSPKFFLGILVPALLVLAALVLFKQHFSRTAPAPVVTTVPSLPAPVAKQAHEADSMPVSPSPAPASVVSKEQTLEERQSAIADERDRLFNWGMSDDPQSLSNILADLNSPEKEIRMAAIEAAKQFGSTNAIPILKAAVVKTDDNEEAAALLEAANFLSLPKGTFTSGGSPMPPAVIQAAQQQRAQYEARRQAQMQQQQGQNAGGNPPSQPGNPPPQVPNQSPAQGQ